MSVLVEDLGHAGKGMDDAGQVEDADEEEGDDGGHHVVAVARQVDVAPHPVVQHRHLEQHRRAC